MSERRIWYLLAAILVGMLYLIKLYGPLVSMTGSALIPGFHYYSCLFPGEQGEEQYASCVSADGMLWTLAAYALQWLFCIPLLIPLAIAWYLSKSPEDKN